MTMGFFKKDSTPIEPAERRRIRRRFVFRVLLSIGISFLAGHLTGRRGRRRDSGEGFEAFRTASALERGQAPAGPKAAEANSGFKSYPSARKIALPAPVEPGSLSLGEAVRRRRSSRDFTSGGIELARLSSLLFYSMGVTGRTSLFGEKDYPLRAAPSPGALFPVECYVAASRIEGLDPGIYHYRFETHELEAVSAGDPSAKVREACLGQEHLGKSAAVFILTSVHGRVRWKYGDRGFRYALIEAGHIAQNLYLAAASLALGCCAAGAFYDEDLDRLLGLDGKTESSLYVVAVGVIKTPAAD